MMGFVLLLVDCIGGRYGTTCGEDCGHCTNNDVCDKSNGYCPSGCSAGYKGNTCQEGMIYKLFDGVKCDILEKTLYNLIICTTRFPAIIFEESTSYVLLYYLDKYILGDVVIESPPRMREIAGSTPGQVIRKTLKIEIKHFSNFHTVFWDKFYD